MYDEFETTYDHNYRIKVVAQIACMYVCCTLDEDLFRSKRCTVRVLKNDAVLRKRFSELRLRRDLFCKSEGFFRKSEGFFRKSEGFFRESDGFFRRRGRLLPKKRKASNADAEGSEFRSDQYLRS